MIAAAILENKEKKGPTIEALTSLLNSWTKAVETGEESEIND
jgi:hypothetical protein